MPLFKGYLKTNSLTLQYNQAELTHSLLSGGYLLAGIILGLLLVGKPLTQPLQNALTVGFLGSLTTFSALSSEVSDRLLHKDWLHAGIILSLHNICGITATLLAAAAVQHLIHS